MLRKSEVMCECISHVLLYFQSWQKCGAKVAALPGVPVSGQRTDGLAGAADDTKDGFPTGVQPGLQGQVLTGTDTTAENADRKNVAEVIQPSGKGSNADILASHDYDVTAAQQDQDQAASKEGTEGISSQRAESMVAGEVEEQHSTENTSLLLSTKKHGHRRPADNASHMSQGPVVSSQFPAVPYNSTYLQHLPGEATQNTTSKVVLSHLSNVSMWAKNSTEGGLPDMPPLSEPESSNSTLEDWQQYRHR